MTAYQFWKHNSEHLINIEQREAGLRQAQDTPL